MTLGELETCLLSTGYDCAYGRFTTDAEFPFIVYYESGSANITADGGIYARGTNYTVELYTADKDPTAETTLEAAFAAAGIVWAKLETYVESEDMFMITYTFYELEDN